MSDDDPRVISYDSYKAMLEDMARGEQEAMSVLLLPQTKITWGSYCFKAIPDGSTAIQVFGYVHTQDELLALEKEYGASEQEAEYYLEVIRNSHDRGYRKGTYYSEVCPNGEYGSNHMVGMWPITKEDFDYAKEHGWQLSHEAVNRIQNEVETATQEAGESFGF